MAYPMTLIMFYHKSETRNSRFNYPQLRLRRRFGLSILTKHQLLCYVCVMYLRLRVTLDKKLRLSLFIFPFLGVELLDFEVLFMDIHLLAVHEGKSSKLVLV